MQRSHQSRFMGGAIVFPGGRVEEGDALDAWKGLHTQADGPWWDAEGGAARVACCREALEEIGILPVSGPPLQVTALATLRAASEKGSEALRTALSASGLQLDLAALVPLSRWVTPEAEQRRFDARFFVTRAPLGQEGAMDEREAIRTFWSTPAALLEQYVSGEVTLFPPTHRTLELLATVSDVESALAMARASTLEIICPQFVLDEGKPTLALPGDSLHAVRERRVPGGTRYVLEGERWVSRNH